LPAAARRSLAAMKARSVLSAVAAQKRPTTHAAAAAVSRPDQGAVEAWMAWNGSVTPMSIACCEM
jgi:hypothetical protein